MRTERSLCLTILLFAPIALAAPAFHVARAQEAVGPGPKHAAVAEALDRFIAREVADKRLPALSIALVDGPSIVWAKGYGFRDASKTVPADASTVYRVGSVSKLFTDLALMRLVERGEIDLDAPVATYLPDFRPANPFKTVVTLRQLMAHRAGLVRESPVGHYFDPTSPSLADTVKSLNGTSIVYEPGTRLKYSNAGIATVGHVVEKTQGEPFAAYVKRTVLDPIGMSSSSFELTPELSKRLAAATMWTVDGREFPAPGFPLGTSPAGNLYATAVDLGKFLNMIFDEGRGPGGPIVKPETLRAMQRRQFPAPGETGGYGLGFSLGSFEGRLRIGHGGAVYGFATDVSALAGRKARRGRSIASKDCANGTRRADRQ